MTSSKIAVAALALALTACQPQAAAPPPPPDQSAVAAQVEGEAREVVADYNARNAAQAASHDAEDYVGMYAGFPNTVGAEADRAAMAKQMMDPAVHYALTGTPTTTVSKGGDMAVFESGYSFTTTDPASGKPVTENGTWVAIFRRQDDSSMKLWRSILVAGPKAVAPQV